LERSSSQGRDYLKGRDGHGARGISPASIATRKIDVPVTTTANAAPKRFWDGFQWVERTNAPVSGAPDDVTSIANQTRQERRLYVGNLLPSCNDQMLTDFMNACMESCLSGAGISLPEGYTKAVLSVWIAPSQNYAFVEFVTKECALIAMGLTGIEFMGMQLKISRPNNYAYHGSIQSGSLAAETSALLATAMGQQPAAIASTPTWNFTSQPVLNTQTSAEPTPVLATTAPAEQPASLVAGRRDNRPAWMTASNPTS
jgi:hypothetical protein